ncbi:MAG: hypothetical protein HY721_24860 [Planctomycetes bacterium]|nr:hypothetical protein [Planctomycetota bacterium]
MECPACPWTRWSYKATLDGLTKEAAERAKHFRGRGTRGRELALGK